MVIIFQKQLETFLSIMHMKPCHNRLENRDIIYKEHNVSPLIVLCSTETKTYELESISINQEQFESCFLSKM